MDRSEAPETAVATFAASAFAAADLENNAWDLAQPVRITRYWSGEPAPSARHAEARVLWSSKALHVRFVCNQAEPLVCSNEPDLSRKTMNLWDRDVCEIFLAPDPNAIQQYLEFEVAPTGEWLDVAVDWSSGARQSDWQFNSGMTVGARIAKNEITMALRIPWNDRLPEPQKGARWRANFFRCVGPSGSRGYLSWQPTRTAEPNFHVPQALGWLVFQ